MQERREAKMKEERKKCGKRWQRKDPNPQNGNHQQNYEP